MLKNYGVEIDIIEKVKRLNLESKVTKTAVSVNSNNLRKAMKESKLNFHKNMWKRV